MNDDKTHIGKYGTDSRFPYWRGGVLDTKFFNGATALALLLNWGLLIYAHADLATGAAEPLWSMPKLSVVGLAIASCLVTALLIRHSDGLVQRYTRAFACGLPLATNLGLLAFRLMSS